MRQRIKSFERTHIVKYLESKVIRILITLSFREHSSGLHPDGASASTLGFGNILTPMACFPRHCLPIPPFRRATQGQERHPQHTEACMATALAANPPRSSSSIQLGLDSLPLGPERADMLCRSIIPACPLIFPSFVIPSYLMYMRCLCPEAFVGATSGRKDITPMLYLRLWSVSTQHRRRM